MRFSSCLFILLLCFSSFGSSKTIVVGAKKFTENYIVAEVFSQLLEDRGFTVKRKFGLGGTIVAYNALESGEIDIYPEYTGTITEAILKSKDQDLEVISKKLAPDGIEILPLLGFNNTYATVTTKKLSEKKALTKISDLKSHPELLGAFSFEFQGRQDGWPSMKKVYQLSHKVRGIEIPLIYEALKEGQVDFIEAYSTEPMILKYGFVVLEDDKNFFPKYFALPMVRKELDQQAKAVIAQLENKISTDQIIKLNSLAVNGIGIPRIANDFLVELNLVKESKNYSLKRSISWSKMWQRTKDHIYLAGLAVLFACIVAIPLATWMAPYKKLSQWVLSFTGILQTIPSIALLTFMIPFFGIGFKPAIVGLFIYSLLPILRNTHIAMTTIDPRLVTAARGIGLYPSEVLFSVKLPLAFPTILAGVRTATIINIGTATLAAFIGAGGLGEPIVTGLALNDTSQVLQGAIPAAILAILVDATFGLIEKSFSKHI